MPDQPSQERDIPPNLPTTNNSQVKGVLNPRVVRNIAFYVITLCILVSVTVSILAIWDFAKEGALWRTVATCLVIAAGAGVFSMVNVMFGETDSKR